MRKGRLHNCSFKTLTPYSLITSPRYPDPLLLVPPSIGHPQQCIQAHVARLNANIHVRIYMFQNYCKYTCFNIIAQCFNLNHVHLLGYLTFVLTSHYFLDYVIRTREKNISKIVVQFSWLNFVLL